MFSLVFFVRHLSAHILIRYLLWLWIYIIFAVVVYLIFEEMKRNCVYWTCLPCCSGNRGVILANNFLLFQKTKSMFEDEEMLTRIYGKASYQKGRTTVKDPYLHYQNTAKPKAGRPVCTSPIKGQMDLKLSLFFSLLFIYWTIVMMHKVLDLNAVTFLKLFFYPCRWAWTELTV